MSSLQEDYDLFCAGRVKFATEETARRNMLLMPRVMFGHMVTVHQCWFCEQWHIGPFPQTTVVRGGHFAKRTRPRIFKKRRRTFRRRRAIICGRPLFIL